MERTTKSWLITCNYVVRHGDCVNHVKVHDILSEINVKSVQSALSDLKRPLNVYSPSAIIGLSLLNSMLMARFLKQSFAQTCLKETDNGKLQQFNYYRSLITNRGTVERGIGRIAKNYYAPLGGET